MSLRSAPGSYVLARAENAGNERQGSSCESLPRKDPEILKMLPPHPNFISRFSWFYRYVEGAIMSPVSAGAWQEDRHRAFGGGQEAPSPARL